jgi:hypothetical protein
LEHNDVLRQVSARPQRLLYLLTRERCNCLARHSDHGLSSGSNRRLQKNPTSRITAANTNAVTSTTGNLPLKPNRKSDIANNKIRPAMTVASQKSALPILILSWPNLSWPDVSEPSFKVKTVYGSSTYNIKFRW